jgi:DNA-binding LacI/PurR family transcriptional regulator
MQQVCKNPSIRVAVVRQRAPTMADIAEAAGVSRALVSIVIRDVPGASAETRKHVRKVADELGYRPHTGAQMLRRRASRHLGVLFTPKFPFEVEQVEAIYPAARSFDYDVVLGAMTPTRHLNDAVDELLSYRCEAMIMLGVDHPDAWFQKLRERAAIVRIGRRLSKAGVDVVRSDEHLGISLALDHLCELGHRRIAFVGAGKLPGAEEREEAYVAGMKARRLAQWCNVLNGDHTDESGATAARSVLRNGALTRKTPTAIIANNDWTAAGLVAEFRRQNVRVPDDVSVVGVDDSELARRSYLQLTSVSQDPAAIARNAVESVHRRLAAPSAPLRDTVLTPQLVIRRSTARSRGR